MTVDERLEALTARHEALTMNVERMSRDTELRRAEFDREMAEHRLRSEREMAEHQRQSDADTRKTRTEMRRWAALGVREARAHRARQREIDEYITRLAAAQLVTEEKLAAFIASLGSRNGGQQQ